MSVSRAYVPAGTKIIGGGATFDFTTPTNIKEILEQRTAFQKSIMPERAKTPTILKKQKDTKI